MQKPKQEKPMRRFSLAELRAIAIRQTRLYIRELGKDPNEYSPDQAWNALDGYAQLHPDSLAAQWQHEAYRRYEAGTEHQINLFNTQWKGRRHTD